MPNFPFRREGTVGQCRICIELSAHKCSCAIRGMRIYRRSNAPVFCSAHALRLCFSGSLHKLMRLQTNEIRHTPSDPAGIRKENHMNQEAVSRQGYTVKGNELWIEEVPISKIAKNCPTPLYVYSTAMLKKNMSDFAENFVSPDFKTHVYYASKALNIKAVLELAASLGLGIDTVSEGELYTALQAGVKPENILFHGNNKSEAELKMCLENNVGCIVLDNVQEARDLARLREDYPKADPKLLLRINPCMSAHTHDYIVTSKIDSKFGINKEHLEDIRELVSIVDTAGYNFAGFHCHIGSQIFEKGAFEQEIAIMCQFIADFEKETNTTMSVLDLGGGFAAWYASGDAPINVKEVCETILGTLQKECTEKKLSLQEVWIEPGRSITANAGATLYTAGYTKTTPHRQYCFIDGGMSDNIRPALYQAEYTADLPLRMDEEATETYCIAGKCCESGDLIIEEARLPKVEKGDLLITYTTGAYGYSMASMYNKLPIPGILMIDKDQAYYAVKPMSLQDLMARECDLNEEKVF